MRTKRLLSLVMAFFMLFTLTAPTFAWASEGDGNDGDGDPAIVDPDPVADPDSDPDPDPVADPDSDPDPDPVVNPDPDPVDDQDDDQDDLGDDPAPDPDPQAPATRSLSAGYYLVGTMAMDGTTWVVKEQYKLSENTQAAVEEYMINVTLPANTEVKVVYCDGNGITAWYPEGTGNDYELPYKTYTIYFRPYYNGGDDWHYKCLYAKHNHVLTDHAATAATCTTAGNNAYWSCANCGKYFSDAAGTTEIAADSWVIPATGHTLTNHPAVSATCTTAGNNEYWSCSGCGKFFSDAQGTTEIAENSWVISALVHDMGEWTYGENGATRNCSRCEHSETVTYPQAVVTDLSVADPVTANGDDYQLAKLVRFDFANGQPTQDQLDAFGDWYCDYVVYADRDVPANSMGLYGAYGGMTQVLTSDQLILANQPIILVNGVMGVDLTFRDIYTIVQQFTCGAFDVDYSNAGTTLYVELRIWDGAGHTHTVNTMTHTFASAPAATVTVDDTGATTTVTPVSQTATAAEIPANTFVAGNDKKPVEVSIPGSSATVTFTDTAAAAIATAAKGAQVDLSVTTATENGVMTVTIAMTAGSTEVFDETHADGAATVTVPYAVADGKLPVVNLVVGGVKTPVAVTGYTATTVTFQVSHFSQYEVSQQDATVSVTSGGTTKYYNNLAAAISEAASGATVTLLADVDLSAHARNDAADYVLNNLTLDLGGHTIRGFNNGIRFSGTNAVIMNGTFDFVAAEAKPSYALSVGSWTEGAAKSTGMQLQNLTVVGGVNVDNADVTLTNVTINQGAGAFYCLWVDEDNNASATFVSGTINAGANATAVFGAAKAASGTTDGTLNVTGGTINANGRTLVLASGNHINVSGGTFDTAVPEADCASGYIPTDDGNGNYGVKSGTYVAQVGNDKYESLADAVAAADSGDTITLLADVNLGSSSLTIDKALTLTSESGHTYTITSSATGYAIQINGSGDVTISDVNVTATSGFGIQAGTPTTVAYTGDLTYSGGTITVAKRGINVYGTGNLAISNAVIQSNVADPTTTYTTGEDSRGINLMGGLTATITNSTIKGFSYDINIPTSGSNSTVIMTGGATYGRAAVNNWANNNVFTMNGVTVNGINNQTGSTEAFACIVDNSPANGNTYNINNCTFNANLSAAAANTSGSSATEELFDLRGTNSVLHFTGTNTYTPTVAGSAPTPAQADRFGLTTQESGLSNNTVTLDSDSASSLADELAELSNNVGQTGGSGGSVTLSFDPEVLYYWATNSGYSGNYYTFDEPYNNGWLDEGEFIRLQKNVTLDKNLSNANSYSLLLNGYTLTAGAYTIEIAAGKTVTSDTAGLTFFTAPAGYRVVEAGSNGTYTYTATAIDYVAQIGNVKYETLAAAFAAITDNTPTTIEVLADSTGAGIVVPSGRNITVNFNNHTYTVNSAPLAGSTNTQNQCFQLLAGSTIIFNNGAIVANNANVKMIIQNYANLTLNGMTLDGTAGTNALEYVLSTNNGSTTINNTAITAPAGAIAFDVCTGWGGYTSNAVEVTGTSAITGDVEVSFYGTGTAPTLTLTSGTLTGSIVVDEAHGGAQVTVTKVDADFNATAPGGYRWVSDNGVSTLTAIPYVAQVGETKYEVFADAVTAANGSLAITLLQDIADPYTLTAGETLKVALNGNTITVQAPADYILHTSEADANGVTTYTIVAAAAKIVYHDNTTYSTTYLDPVYFETLEAALNAYPTATSGYISVNGSSVRVKVVMTLLADAGDVTFPERVYNGLNLDTNGKTINVLGIEGPYILKVSNQTNYTYYYTNGANASITRDGVTRYYTLDGAIADVQEGETIVFVGDVYSNVTVDSGKTFTIDLNGKNYKGTLKLKYGFVTFENGTVTKTIYVYGGSDSTLGVGEYNHLTIADDVALTNVSNSIILYNHNYGGEGSSYGSLIDVYGTTTNIWVIGNLHGGNCTINIQDGAVVSDTEGIGLNGAAIVNVYDGATITGTDIGIEVRAGVLNVYGGNITGGSGVPGNASQGSGAATTNVGIAVAQHVTELPITVAISGGTISGGAALYFANPENNDDKNITVLVTGGSFTGANGRDAIKIEANEPRIANFVQGGIATTPITVSDADTAHGYYPVATTGGYTVSNQAVALVYEAGHRDNGIAYTDLAAAITAATAGYTVEQLANVALSATQVIDKNLTIDLNGHNITATDARALWIKAGEVEIIGTGTITSTHTEGNSWSEDSSVIRVGNSGADKAKLTLGAGVTVAAPYSYGVTVFGTNTNGVELVVNGTVTATGRNGAISGNGNSGNKGAVTINAGAVVSSAADAAIYHPQNDTLTINGGTITGPTAVYVKCGTVEINGGTLTGNGAKTAYSFNGNGCNATGDALVVDNCNYPGGVSSVTISGGTLSSTNGKGVGSYTGNGATELAPVHATTNTITIPADEKWVDDGNGGYTLVKKVYVAQIGDVKYETLADAIAAVPADGTQTTITMIADETINVATGALTIAAGKKVVIDLNGHTVTGYCQSGTASALITNYGTLTLKDSTDAYKDGTGSGKMYAGANPAWIYDGGDDYSGSYASNMITNRGNLTIESGYYESTTNGSAAYVIDNYSNGIVVINGGHLYDYYTQAIRLFLNSSTADNSVTINGGIIDGYAAIWMQNSNNSNQTKGSLRITGGTINTTERAVVEGTKPIYEGSSYLLVYPSNPNMTFEVTGGTFNVNVWTHGNGNNLIEDGNFNGYVKGGGGSAPFIKGGEYAVEPNAAYIVEGYIASEKPDSDTYIIGGPFVAAIGNTGYTTLAKAFAAITDNTATTIEVLADSTGAGIVVPSGRNITVNFNGHSYTVVEGPGAGSAGTQNQVFQLLENSTIVFNGGTIAVGEENATLNTYYRVIQNYANLTLNNMEVKGDNLKTYNGFTNSVIESDCGVVSLTGTTKILDVTGGANPIKAINVDAWNGYYPAGTQLTINLSEGGQIGTIHCFTEGTGTAATSSLMITAGTVGGLTVDEGNTVVVTKAETAEVAAPAGYLWSEAEAGVQTLTKGVASITIGGQTTVYASLEAAVAAAVDGDTITLLSDCEGNGIVFLQGKFGTNGLTIDFGHYTYTVSGTPVGSTGTETIGFQLLKDNKITLKDGTLTGSSRTNRDLMRMIQNYSDLTLDNMTISLVGQYYDQTTMSTCNGALVINNSTINAPDFTWANINDSSYVGGAAFSVGTFSSYTGASATVTGNSTINGDIIVDPSTNAEQNTLTLTSGTLNGAILMKDNAADATVTQKDTFNATAPEDYEWVSNGDGTSTLRKIPYVAQIGNVKYLSLADAIATVGDGETIVMIDDEVDAHGLTVSAGKNFTVNFDGHTYTVNKPGAGSTGTETAAFQLLAGSTITFKNGTIQVDADNQNAAVAPAKNIKRMFQSYANVTFEDMVVDGTNLYGDNAANEFCNGNVAITGDSSFSARNGVAAINVDAWNGAYPDGAHVTINTTGSIGTIYCYTEGTGAEAASELMIEAGNIAGLTVAEGNTVTVQKDENANVAAPEGYTWSPAVNGVETLIPYVQGNLKLSISLTLKDNINLNLIAKELAAGTEPGDYSIIATFRGRTKTYRLSDATVVVENNVTKYKVNAAQVYSYEMGMPVTFRVMYLDTELTTFTYSVKDYFTSGIKGSAFNANEKAICLAGLDYGAAAQLYFDGKTYNDGTYDTDVANLVNNEFNPDNAVSATKPEGYQISTSGEVPTGLSKMSVSLILGSEVSIKVYFKYSGDVNDLTFSAYRMDNDELVKTVTRPVAEDGGRYSVKITGINSYELWRDFTLSISDGSNTFKLNYSPYYYIQVNWESSDKLADLCHALKKYGDLAKELWPNG